MNLGLPELLVIAAVALLFFGPSRLPGLGKSIGEAIRGFKKGMNEEGEQERLAEPTEKPKYHADEKVKEEDKNKA